MILPNLTEIWKPPAQCLRSHKNHWSQNFSHSVGTDPEISDSVVPANLEISIMISTLLNEKFQDQYPGVRYLVLMRNFEISTLLIEKFRDLYQLNEKIFEISDFLWEYDPSHTVGRLFLKT